MGSRQGRPRRPQRSPPQSSNEPPPRFLILFFSFCLFFFILFFLKKPWAPLPFFSVLFLFLQGTLYKELNLKFCPFPSHENVLC